MFGAGTRLKKWHNPKFIITSARTIHFTVAQRLMHLEAYSDKLSDMLDKNQTADDKAREKFTKEVKEYKQLVLQKDGRRWKE